VAQDAIENDRLPKRAEGDHQGVIKESAMQTILSRIFSNATFPRAVARTVRSARAGALPRALLGVALLLSGAPGWSAETPRPPAGDGAPKTVNINTADAATLAEVLKGVGLAKAEAIIAYRKEHGGFKSVEQLAEVKGIGDKLVKANQERIVVK
jgi:competence protein ComEA